MYIYSHTQFVIAWYSNCIAGISCPLLDHFDHSSAEALGPPPSAASARWTMNKCQYLQVTTTMYSNFPIRGEPQRNDKNKDARTDMHVHTFFCFFILHSDNIEPMHTYDGANRHKTSAIEIPFRELHLFMQATLIQAN